AGQPRRGANGSGRLRRDGAGWARAQVAQRLRGVLNPLLRVGAFGRMREERLQMALGPVGVAALQEQEGEAVVRAGQARVELEGAPIMPDRLVDAPALG